jgi:heme/copper-type cytochrome/quinol oxidase subunit 4
MEAVLPAMRLSGDVQGLDPRHRAEQDGTMGALLRSLSLWVFLIGLVIAAALTAVGLLLVIQDGSRMVVLRR